ncbi:hypothetical protein AB0L40_06400 [Patulibacter sp. NPDC049589]|uniref:hypothetical protein n=1 Tax=Patulibacter sp. NPDC049589 TaxID=3154731 RepID=UPI00342351AB
MFCRHGRREDRCIVCLGERRRAREAATKKANGKISSARRAATSRAASRTAAAGAVGARRAAASSSVRVKKMTRHAEDGWGHDLLPGLRSSGEALDLLGHLSRARVRLDHLATDAPGPYATARALAGGEADDREEATWILFQVAYYGPLEGDEPFREIDRLLVRREEALPAAEVLSGVSVGPRGAHAHDRGVATLQGYRDWAERVGGQLKGLGAGGTDPARRFDAAFRALALPGLHRDARFEFLVTLGATGLLDAAPWSLLLDAGRDPVSVAAKRAFLTGDAVLLQRRFGAFARAVGVPVAAFDLGLRNWDLRPGPSVPLGYLEGGVPSAPDAEEVALLAAELGLETPAPVAE